MNTMLAFLCVSLFSLTVPATRFATQALTPEAVAALRLIGAGAVCSISLLLVDRWLPPRRIWFTILLTSLASVVGFSLLISMAMKRVPGTHGAIALATMPALTAAYASLRDRVSPGFNFWLYCFLGTGASMGFFLLRASGEMGLGDVLLFAAAAASSFGYVEGARLSREFGGRKIMSWAIVLALPFAVALASWLSLSGKLFPSSESSLTWISVAYLAVFSQSLGMFLWYRVLSKGNMAKTALVQLAQPFLTILASIYFLGETASPLVWFVAMIVVASIFGANREKRKVVQIAALCAKK